MELNQVDDASYKKMINYGTAIVRRRYTNHPRVEELIEHVPEAVCMIVLRFNGKGVLYNYFRAHIHHKIIDYVRAHFISRRGKIRDTFCALQCDEEIEKILIDNSYLTLYYDTRLHEEINKLPKLMRSVIEMYHFDGMYYYEIGIRIGRTKTRVYQILKDAHCILRSALDPAVSLATHGGC